MIAVNKIFLTHLLSLVLYTGLAHTNNSLNINKEIDALITQAKSTHMGILIKNLNNESLYSLNENANFIPASVTKLYTALAAFSYLGSHYRYQTQLLTDATEIKQGQLEGSVYIKFSGDPTLNEEDLARLLKKLSYYGIHEITADLILIPANPEPYGPGWMFEDMSNADGAPLGPFIINKNLLMVMINPAAEVGHPAELDIKSWSGGIEVKNQISTAKKEENCSIQVNYPSETSITLKGCIAQSATVNTVDVAIKNPQVYLVYLIQKLLASNGIKLKGNIRSGPYPNKAWTMYTHQSTELSQIINDFLKSSINLYAEAVFLTLGKEYFHSSESGFTLSQKAEYEILGKLGISLDQVKLVDGSGLSRYNLVTPASLMAALQIAYKQFPYSFEYLSALPIAGLDGTLMNRMTGMPLIGKVRAKTGNMSGVSNLAGMIQSEKGELYFFTFFFNNFTSSADLYKLLQDKLCLILFKN